MLVFHAYPPRLTPYGERSLLEVQHHCLPPQVEETPQEWVPLLKTPSPPQIFLPDLGPPIWLCIIAWIHPMPKGGPPPELSIWSMPPLEASLPKGPVVSPRYRPPIGRAAQLRATLSGQTLVLQAPQMAPPIHQSLPFPRGWPATPYQQAVQPLGKSSGLGVTFDSSATKPAPTGGQDTNVHGRQGT